MSISRLKMGRKTINRGNSFSSVMPFQRRCHLSRHADDWLTPPSATNLENNGFYLSPAHKSDSFGCACVTGVQSWRLSVICTAHYLYPYFFACCVIMAWRQPLFMHQSEERRWAVSGGCVCLLACFQGFIMCSWQGRLCSGFTFSLPVSEITHRMPLCICCCLLRMSVWPLWIVCVFVFLQGLFRIAAGASKLKKLKAALDCSTSQLEEFYSDPHAVAGMS